MTSLKITAPGDSPNTDGIDLHGEPFYIFIILIILTILLVNYYYYYLWLGVDIHDSKISVGDDNVAIHVSNVLIENCNFGTGHGASIGSISGGTYTY